MKKNKYLILILGLIIVVSIASFFVWKKLSNNSNTIENQTQEDSIMKKPEDMTEEERAKFSDTRGEKPDFENMTEEEKAEFEAKRGEKPDFENMTDEEKAEFEKNKPTERPESPEKDSSDVEESEINE